MKYVELEYEIEQVILVVRLLILLLALHGSVWVMFGIFLFAFFRLHLFLHLEGLWDIESSLDGWPIIDFVQPFLYFTVSILLVQNLRSFVRFQNSDSREV